MMMRFRKFNGKFALLSLVALALVLVVPTVAAQESRSVTLTEDQINSSFRVTAPRLRVENVSVDLQPGQVVISGTITPLRTENSYAATVTLVPTVDMGIITWTVTTATVDGQAATEAQVAQINSALANSWRRYIKETYSAGRVQSLTIDELTLTITFGEAQRDPERPGIVEIEDGIVQVTLTEEQINSSYRIQNIRRVRVTAMAVDLQPGQIVVLSSWQTLRTDDSFQVETTIIPILSDGMLSFAIDSVSVGATEAEPALLDQINNALASSWRAFWRAQVNRGTVTGISITDDLLTYTAQLPRGG